jgi:hypothetical protein
MLVAATTDVFARFVESHTLYPSSDVLCIALSLEEREAHLLDRFAAALHMELQPWLAS